jgi:hypothetical protein
MADVANNPAGRLLDLLNQANGVRLESVRQVWCAVFGIDTNDTPSLLRRLATLRELPEQAAAAVRSLPNEDHEHLLTWRSRVEGVLHGATSHVDGNWRAAARALDEVAMYSLDSCARKLARVRPEAVLPEGTVAELHRSIRDLLAAILKADLEPQVRDFLLEQLRAADEALQEYRIRGVRGLREALDRMAGRAWSQHDVARRAAQTDEGKRVGTALIGFAKAVGEIIQTAAAAATLYTFFVGGQVLPAPAIHELLTSPPAIDGECVELPADPLALEPPAQATPPSDGADGH